MRRCRVVLVRGVVRGHGIETLMLIPPRLRIIELLLVLKGELVCHIRDGECLVVQLLVAWVGCRCTPLVA